MSIKEVYGYELILDLHNCDATKFNRESIKKYLIKLCKIIEMERCELYFWDDLDLPPEECEKSPHTKGTSCVQFILTSSIVIHTLDILESVYINIFSCKEFNNKKAKNFTKEWFSAKHCISHFIKRV